MRINTCDHQRGNALIFYQILSTNSLRKCVDISLENLYVDIGDLRVKGKTADESCLYKAAAVEFFSRGESAMFVANVTFPNTL